MGLLQWPLHFGTLFPVLTRFSTVQARGQRGGPKSNSSRHPILHYDLPLSYPSTKYHDEHHSSLEYNLESILRDLFATSHISPRLVSICHSPGVPKQLALLPVSCARVNDKHLANMALEGAFSAPYPIDHSSIPWQLSSIPGYTNIPESHFPDFSTFEQNKFDSHSPSPALLQAMVPQYVQPHETYKASSPTESVDSTQSRQPTSDQVSSFVSLNRQHTLRRLSLASNDFNNDTYRPRNTPVRRRKATTSRITPRSSKHARELELNRKAATKCRNRQKNFVENLQQKCRNEEARMHEQSALVHALHDEVIVLRNEIMRQSFCGCQSLRTNMPPLAT